MHQGWVRDHVKFAKETTEGARRRLALELSRDDRIFLRARLIEVRKHLMGPGSSPGRKTQRS